MATFSDYLKNIFLVLIILQFAPPLIKGIRQQYGDLIEPKTKVGVISIKGSLYNANTLVKNIEKFFENNEIKAVVLKIDCSGGSSGTCQTIFNELNHYKTVHPHKYVVAIVENMAGSGGYYIASAANYIIAAPSSLIGSIGAYIQHPNLKEFIEHYKIKYEVIKSGAYKTAGNPLLDLTQDQKVEFQGLSDDIYRQFVRDVARQRPQLAADTKLWADGRLFTGEQALALKLIDEVGSPSTVSRVLRENAHITGKIDWIKASKKTNLLSYFTQESDDEDSSQMTSTAAKIYNFFEKHYASVCASLSTTPL